ncbi:MAG TPA: ABC transporter ATP-binding protein [Candidatus Thioglobus sp.]|jgi:branched-chain amino acid transport system ATP-binding protein|nr:ABC transporter ATP-binding protein [Candidatus Thioglobus sp.]HIL42707.1 ABC transporter ATP-binding protein [Gammaproteobacteria bacterium]
MTKKIHGYASGNVETVISVEDVDKQAGALRNKNLTVKDLDKLTNYSPHLSIDNLKAGYGEMEILHDIDLRVGDGQSLCLIGPNGAGKSTILHSIFGFTRIFSGDIRIDGEKITNLTPSEKLKDSGIAYILQDNSVFPDMTVEENLMMGGYLLEKTSDAKVAVEEVLSEYNRLGQRRNNKASSLSGGERRLLEIARSLIMNPKVLLVDEPSIGLEPRFINMVFEILGDLQNNQGKTILMVEQNAKKGLEFCDIGYVIVSGELVLADEGSKLLESPEVGRLFLGG